MITQEMKVYVVYGFWKYENGAIILKVFDTEDKAKEYIDNFDFNITAGEFYSEYDFLECEEKIIE